MNNHDSSIKSMYLTIFILGLVELLLTFVGIATFIIALILQSKLAEAGKPTSPGIKLMLIGSGIHIATLILGLINLSIAFIALFTYSVTFFVKFINIFIGLFNFGAFVVLIIGCIFVYKEYDAIN